MSFHTFFATTESLNMKSLLALPMRLGRGARKFPLIRTYYLGLRQIVIQYPPDQLFSCVSLAHRNRLTGP